MKTLTENQELTLAQLREALWTAEQARREAHALMTARLFRRRRSPRRLYQLLDEVEDALLLAQQSASTP